MFEIYVKYFHLIRVICYKIICNWNVRCDLEHTFEKEMVGEQAKGIRYIEIQTDKIKRKCSRCQRWLGSIETYDWNGPNELKLHRKGGMKKFARKINNEVWDYLESFYLFPSSFRSYQCILFLRSLSLSLCVSSSRFELLWWSFFFLRLLHSFLCINLVLRYGFLWWQWLSTVTTETFLVWWMCTSKVLTHSIRRIIEI